MSNQKLADAAKAAITDASFPLEKGMCQKFVRMVIEKVYGAKYDQYRAASAKESARLWQHSAFALPTNTELEAGDVLYKTEGSGGFGHVGIFVGDKVAENSSTSIGRVQGAKGYRSLADFGPYQVVVRIPDVAAQPAKPDIFLINNRIIQGAELKDGKLFAPVVNVLDSVGFEVDKVNDRRADRGRMDIRAVPVK